MQARRIDPSDLPEIRTWWQQRDEGDMPDGVLPPVGVLAEDWTGPIAAAWIYQPAGVPLVIMDWMVTRPGLDQGTARLACRAVLSELSAIAKRDGCTRIFASVTREGMLMEAVQCGFQSVARDVFHLIKHL